MKLPWWVVAVAVLVSSAGTWWWTARASDEDLRDLQRRAVVADSLLADRDSLLVITHDNLAVLEDSLGLFKIKRDTITVRVVEAGERSHTTAETIQDYLEGDSVGFALLADHLAADAELNSAFAADTLAFAGQVSVLEAQVQLWERQHAADTLAIAELRDLYGDALEQAEDWYRKANPPFTVKLLNHWPTVLGVAVGYLAGKS